MGKKLAENPLVVILGLVASVIAIYTFATGVENIHGLLLGRPAETPTQVITSTSTLTLDTVDFLGQEQFREENPTDYSPQTCKEPQDFLDVYSSRLYPILMVQGV